MRLRVGRERQHGGCEGLMGLRLPSPFLTSAGAVGHTRHPITPHPHSPSRSISFSCANSRRFLPMGANTVCSLPSLSTYVTVMLKQYGPYGGVFSHHAAMPKHNRTQYRQLRQAVAYGIHQNNTMSCNPCHACPLMQDCSPCPRTHGGPASPAASEGAGVDELVEDEL